MQNGFTIRLLSDSSDRHRRQPFATLVNYAIHPEVLGSGQGISQPVPNRFLYERLQEKGAGVGIFMNSA